MKRKINRKYIPLILFGISVFLELFLFNYKHWESLFWKKNHVVLEEYIVGSGLEQAGPMVYRITEAEGEETATIEWLNINEKLCNVHISLEILEPKTAENQAVNIQLKATDAANERYFRLPARDILTSVPKSEYIRLHLSGETEEVLLIINAGQGDLIKINDISGNVKVPGFVSLLRLLTVFGILTAGYYLRPSSGIHKRLYQDITWRGKVMLAAVLGLEILMASAVCRSNFTALENAAELEYMRQYQMLAHSLAEGKTTLDVEVDEVLAALSNPYDYRLRSMVMETEGGDYLWDSAFYEGKYYVYFGIVPELVFFLPWYLITGRDLATMPVVLILGILFMLGVFALMDQIVKRWYPKTSIASYLLITLLAVNGSGLWTCLRNPAFYGIPILSAMVFGTWGICLWLSSLDKEKISLVKMGTGSFFTALIAGCRPQLILLLLLAVPIYGGAVKEGRLLQKNKWKELAAFSVPIFLAAMGIMYYNGIRFGSVTDFGAAYNLTLQDMTHREMVFGRTVFGFFTMLFQPPVVTGVFPYFEQVRIQGQFYGQSIQESGFGGVIACNLVLLAGLFSLRIKKDCEGRDAAAFLFTGIALLIAFFDIQVGGLIPRYTVDFTWLLFFGTALILMKWRERLWNSTYWKQGYLVFCGLFVQSGVFHFLTIFTDVYEKVEEMNPQWFYQAEHLIEFWF